MPKPILLINYPIQNTFEEYERLVVKLQEQLSDYHVIGLPKTKGDLEIKVKSAEQTHEYDILEAKEIITNAVKTYFING
jgi:hypothetical protein